MKTKTIISVSILVVAILSFYGFRSSEEAHKKYTMIRVAEGIVAGPQISVVYEDGKTEEYRIDALEYEKFTKNTKVLNDIINDFSAKGYKLESTNLAGSNGSLFSVYLFSK